ncbi:MAG TPA: hypothetical protein VN836_02655 [Verrucomicrobiae bacterium]|nr:hypothetical protein [Verrucomicrobiae bacterium]
MKQSNWKTSVIVILLFACAAGGNPIPGPLPAHVYISSERLEATVSLYEAAFKGTFTFSAQDLKDSGKEVEQTFMQLPIWFPQQTSDDPTVVAFWNAFGTNMLNIIRPKNKETFEKAVALKVFFEKQAMPVNAFAMLYQNGDQRPFEIFTRPDWVGFREMQDPDFCCLLVRIDGMGELVRRHTPAVITYRQPLVKTGGKGRFFYLPIFENLPRNVSTADTSRYSIKLSATAGCSLTITTGRQSLKVDAGQSVVFAPQDRQAIRATVADSRAE